MNTCFGEPSLVKKNPINSSHAGTNVETSHDYLVETIDMETLATAATRPCILF